MIVRIFKNSKYSAIKEELLQNAQFNPSDGSYNMIVRVNKTDYILKLQLSDDCKLIVWEAIEVTHRDDGENNYTMIVKDSVLSSLLHILLWQNVTVSGKNLE